MDLLKIEMMIMNHQINNITNQIESMTTGHKYCDILMVSLLTENICFQEFCDDLEELCIN